MMASIVILFVSAYGDTALLSHKVKEGLSSTGISLVHVPSGRKEASDKAILVDMCLWCVEHPPPAVSRPLTRSKLIQYSSFNKIVCELPRYIEGENGFCRYIYRYFVCVCVCVCACACAKDSIIVQ